VTGLNTGGIGESPPVWRIVGESSVDAPDGRHPPTVPERHVKLPSLLCVQGDGHHPVAADRPASGRVATYKSKRYAPSKAASQTLLHLDTQTTIERRVKVGELRRPFSGDISCPPKEGLTAYGENAMPRTVAGLQHSTLTTYSRHMPKCVCQLGNPSN
jgi:hypothetical protein